jgi:protein-tyrosine phosphatase
MAYQAQADGIDAICATPHIRHDHYVSIPDLPRRLAELTEAVRAAGASTRILPGGEVAVTAVAGLEDDELATVSLGGSGRWILLEPPPGPLDRRLDDAVQDLHSRGYRALIAHPERHAAADLIERLAGLIDRGALVQATAAFFQDTNSREGMLRLARAGVVHVLASDSHSSRAGRPVAISPALRELRTVEPVSGQLDWVAGTAPAAIAGGRELTSPFAPRRS